MNQPKNYLLQDSRKYAGNDILFWSIHGGYTTDFDEAERFTEVAAFTQHQSRDSDIPWLESTLERSVKRVVDVQYVDRQLNNDSMNARIKELGGTV